MSTNALTTLERYGAFRAAVTASPRLQILDDVSIVEDIGTTLDDSFGYTNLNVRIHRFMVCLDASVLIGGSLACTALLNAYTAQTTTAPKEYLVRLPHHGRAIAASVLTSKTLAQAAVEEIKALSSLTNELIAPLVGVSRRSLQAWIAGEAISHPKEQRLLKLRDALRELDAGNPTTTYRRIMDQAPSRVRVYDLLASERFEVAVDIATGRRRVEPSLLEKPERESLLVQLSRLEDRVNIVEAPSTGRFSGRLRR